MSSLHLNLWADAQANVLVFLYQARNADVSLQASLILRTFVPLVVSFCKTQTLTYGQMRSKPYHHSAADLTLSWSRYIQSIDGSHPPIQVLTKFTALHMRLNPHSEMIVNLTLLLEFSYSKAQLCSWNSPHSEVWITLYYGSYHYSE